MKKIMIDDRSIEYRIVRSHRKTIGIHIKPDEGVIIRAPKRISKKRIKNIVKKKSKWIFKKLEEMQEMASPPEPLSFISGEKVLYLGKDILLDIKKRNQVNKGKYRPSINLKENQLVISLPDRMDRLEDKTIIKDALIKWYKAEARKKILERIEKYQKYIGRKPEKIRIKAQKTIWGSCSSKGNLNFNWKLIMAPLPVLDYIVVHEMVHLIHPNHSKEYWQMVEKIIPDYRKRKQWLKENGPAMDIL